MAASTTKSGTILGLKKQALDPWTVRERLLLASSVQQSGDQNWVSVSRAIRNQSDHSRTSEYFSQKNCAQQYAELLEKAETPKRKRSEKNEVVETPATQVFRKLTLDRIDELKQEIRQTQDQYRRLSSEIEMVSSGHCDDQLAEIWEQIQKRQREKDEKLKLADAEKLARKAAASKSNMDIDDNSTQDSFASQEAVIEVDDKVETATTTVPPTPAPVAASVLPSPSKPTQMLNDLLHKVDKPPMTIVDGQAEPGKKRDSTPSAGAPTLKKLLNLGQTTPAAQVPSSSLDKVVMPAVKQEVTKVKTEPEQTVPESLQEPVVERVSQPVISEEPNTSTNAIDVETEGHATALSLTGEEETRPVSPCSSVSSKSESRTRKRNESTRSVTSSSTPAPTRRSSRGTTKSVDEGKKKLLTPTLKQASELETSDDENSKILLDSMPPSPASAAPSETEEEKIHKAWKKSVMLVWRATANHRYANVFMHQVTDEIAPGYSSCVFRPMSLSLIKKNIENNVIRTTEEFQRDMMLMFTNAIMYNNADHDVYQMAQEMYDDIMKSIEAFATTQQAIIVREQESKSVSLRGRRSETSEKDGEKMRRRTSSEQQDATSVKKRKTRADD